MSWRLYELRELQSHRELAQLRQPSFILLSRFLSLPLSPSLPGWCLRVLLYIRAAHCSSARPRLSPISLGLSSIVAEAGLHCYRTTGCSDFDSCAEAKMWQG